MSRVQISVESLQDAVSLMQAAELLDQGRAFVLASDGLKVVFLPDDLARKGFCHQVLIDSITSRKGPE